MSASAPGGVVFGIGPVGGALRDLLPAVTFDGAHACEELALIAAMHQVTTGPVHPHPVTFRVGRGSVEAVAPGAHATVTLTGWVTPYGPRFRVTTDPTLPPVEPHEDPETARGAWRDALAYAHAVNATTAAQRLRRWAQLTDRQRATAII